MWKVEPIYEVQKAAFNIKMKEWENIQKAQEEKARKETEEDLGLEPEIEPKQEKIPPPKAPMPPETTVKKWFVISNMVVQNEQTQRDEYFSMRFVEYLEAICRAALYFRSHDLNAK